MLLHPTIQVINDDFYTLGQYGAYDAIRHLWQKSGIFDHLIKEDTLLVSRDHSVEDIETARTKVGAEFRAKHKMNEDDTVVFLAPGILD